MAHEAHEAHDQHAPDDGKSSRLIEQILFVVLLGAGGYALFGPKSPPSPKPEPTAAAAVTAPNLRAQAQPSARSPQALASALGPKAMAEMQQIQAARRALSQGKPDDALKELKAYEQKYPGGRLADDATLMRVEAHLKKGDRATATKLASELQKKAPDSRQYKRAQRLLENPAPATAPAR